MNKRIVLVGMGVALMGATASACEVVASLQKATLSDSGGGGQGGTTTTSSGGTSSGGTMSTGGTTTTVTACEPGTTIECYDGPDGTKGTGICHSGTQACKADGSGYEMACDAQQTPQGETCAVAVDEDCDGHDCARWAHVYGDDASQVPSAVGTDAAGNAYVLGSFAGALTVVNPALVSAGGSDIFLVKLDPAGNVIWAKRYGDNATQFGGSMSVDQGGNVAFAVPFDGTVDFGKGPIGPAGTAIVKIDPDGNTVWSRWNPTKLSLPRVALNMDGDVVLWASFSGSVDFGKGVFTTALFTDVALAKYASGTGNALWAKQFGYSGNYDHAEGVAIDGGNNIVVCGDYKPKINLGGGDLMQTNSSYSELFLARFDENGGYAAAASYAKMTASQLLKLDSVGSAHMVDVEEVAQSQYSSALQKVNNMVAEVWIKTYSGYMNDIAVDASDNVGFALLSDGSLDVGGGVLPAVGAMDIVLAKLDFGGAHLWSRRFGALGEAQDFPVIATAPNGDIVMAAGVSGTIDVGTGPLVSKGQDLLVARFAP